MCFVRLLSTVVFALAPSLTYADEPATPIEPEAVALGGPVEFVRDVQPILQANCTACHSTSSDESDLSLETVEVMTKGGGRGPALVPGKPDESLLLAVASHQREPVMPPPDNDVQAKNLTPRELGILKQWILEGALQGEGTGSMVAWRPLPAGLKAIRSVALSRSSRFVAAARANQVEVRDLLLGGDPIRLVDPHLASLTHETVPLYPEGAADLDLVQSVAFSPDGRWLASGGYRAIKLWRRNGPVETPPLEISGANALASSADGDAMSVAVGNEIKVLTAADGSVSATWSVPAKVIAMAFSADGTRVAAVCEDTSIHAWSRDGAVAAPPRMSPSPATAIAFVGDRIVTARDVGILNVWTNEAEQPERELNAHSGRIASLIGVPGQPNGLLSVGEDGTLHLWDVTSESPLRSISHGGPIASIDVTPDAKMVATCGPDGAVRFWNLSDGAKVAEHAGLIARQRAAQSLAATLEWRKQLAAVADARLKEAEAAVKEREEIQKKSVEAKDAAVQAVPVAKTAADEAAAASKTAADQSAAKPDDEALKKQAEEAQTKAAAAQAAFVAAEDALKSATRAVELADEALRLNRERFASGQQSKTTADAATVAAEAAANAAAETSAQSVAATALACTTDGSRFVVGYADGTLQTFSTAGQPLDAVTLSGGGIVAVAPGTDSVASVLCQDGAIRRADVIGPWSYAATLGPPAEAPLALSKSTIVDRVLALSFSPDGTSLVSGGGEPSRGGELIVWNLEQRQPSRVFAEPHSDTIQAVDFSRDGRTLVTAGADKFARAFDIESGSVLRTLEGHTEQVLGVALKADGTTIASASADLAVKVWDLESGEQRRTIPGHGKQVTAIQFVGLTEDVVTAAGDRTVRLYRTSNGQHLRTFGGAADYVNAVDASDDGATIVAGGEDGVLFVWDGTTAAVRHRFEPPAAGTPTARAAD